MAAGQVELAQMTMTNHQNNIIAGLGHMAHTDEGEAYFESGDDRMDCLKDIVRNLRRDHPEKRHL